MQKITFEGMLRDMRSLSIAIVIVAAILVSTGLFVYYNSAWILSTILSSQFKTAVVIDKVDFLSEEIEIKGISVANPQGATAPYAMTAKYLDIKAPYGNYFHKKIEINEIVLDEVVMYVEYFEKDEKLVINWTVLTGNLGEGKTKESVSKRVGRSAFIHHLLIKNITIHIISPGKKEKIAKIPSLEFKDIQTDDGKLTKHITEAIVYRMIFNMKNIVDIPFDAATGGVNNVFNTIDDIFSPFFGSDKEKENAEKEEKQSSSRSN